MSKYFNKDTKYSYYGEVKCQFGLKIISAQGHLSVRIFKDTYKGVFVNKSSVFGISLGNINVYRAKENKHEFICIMIITL